MRTIIATLCLVGCGGMGSVETEFDPTTMTAFRSQNLDIATIDADADGVLNIFDNCANIRNDGSDFDNDGLGDACDARPQVANYLTAPSLGGAGAAIAAFWLAVDDSDGEEPPEVTPEVPTDTVEVPVIRTCRVSHKGRTITEAANPIVEITDQKLQTGNHSRHTVITEATVFGSAPLIADSPFPTIDIPVDSGALGAALGEKASYTEYSRFCDDENYNDRCDLDEKVLNAWKPHYAANENPDAAWVVMKLVGNKNLAPEDPECDVGISSPLVLDLDGDGIWLSNFAVRFDLDGNDTEDLIAWTAGFDDAFLALDLDGNGVVSSGAELFGNSTRIAERRAANGFEALAQYDDDGDNRITPRDRIFRDLLLWTDDNRDGRSQLDEVRRLDDEGITAISVAYMSAHETDAHGNETRQRALFFRGSKHALVVDAWVRMLVLRKKL